MLISLSSSSCLQKKASAHIAGSAKLSRGAYFRLSRFGSNYYDGNRSPIGRVFQSP